MPISPLTNHTHTHKCAQCLVHLAYLICGNGGSSDEGRDGGLCNHAVGGDAVRRGVEPDKGQTRIHERTQITDVVHKPLYYIRNDMVIQ